MASTQTKQSLRVLVIIASFILGIFLSYSLTRADEIMVSPPENGNPVSPPCQGMSDASSMVHFEGDRWLQVCTDGASLLGVVLDYGTNAIQTLFNLEADDGVYFKAPRAAIMQAGGIVVLWNQTTAMYEISADTPIFMAQYDYDGKQLAPARKVSLNIEEKMTPDNSLPPGLPELDNGGNNGGNGGGGVAIELKQ